MSQELQSSLILEIQKRFPKLHGSGIDLKSLVSENLLSPYRVELPHSVLKSAQDFIAQVFALRESDSYQQSVAKDFQQRHLIDPGNKSICMSYDFHLNEDQQLKLIEINTNASFLALADLMYKTRAIPQPVLGFEIDELKENILMELDLFGQSNLRPEIAIVDEKPSEQRLYVEFLIYQQMMIEWGFPTSIKDVTEISGLEDFIYNRSTDFYFEHSQSQKLKDCFLNKKICFSPNPCEYFYLADKERMIEWSRSSSFDSIRPFLGHSEEVTAASADQLWTERKKFFFKPLRSHGAKQSFRGSSISRKAFDEIVGQGFIAQEFLPAPELKFENFAYKYDLRFYAYRGRLQSVVARLYQGQVTNLRTPGGGFAPVIFK